VAYERVKPISISFNDSERYFSKVIRTILRAIFWPGVTSKGDNLMLSQGDTRK
jgi:hypothetical protein